LYVGVVCVRAEGKVVKEVKRMKEVSVEWVWIVDKLSQLEELQVANSPLFVGNKYLLK